jgi:flagellar motility protein MotE (MotC chaperone)
MDKKILIIGFATMIMVVLSTLALVGLLVEPRIFGVHKTFISDTLSVKFNPKLDSIRQDSLKRANIERNIYIYDKMNYSLSTLSLKREKLLLRDSIYKIWKIVDSYKKREDSVTKALNSGSKTVDSLKKTVVKLSAKGVKEPVKSSIEYSNEQIANYSKVYEGMDAAKAAKQIELMSEEDALQLLISMQPRPAAKILDKIEPIKAAKIWLILNSKKKR